MPAKINEVKFMF